MSRIDELINDHKGTLGRHSLERLVLVAALLDATRQTHSTTIAMTPAQETASATNLPSFSLPPIDAGPAAEIVSESESEKALGAALESLADEEKKVDFVTDQLRKLIIARSSTREMAKLAVNQGMRTLRMVALDRARAGITTLEQVMLGTSAY